MKKYVYYYKVIKLQSALSDQTKGRPFKYMSYDKMIVGHRYYSTSKGNIKVLELLEIWDINDSFAPIYG